MAQQMFASLHIKNPIRQTDGEISYAGYKRVPVVYHEKFGQQKLVIEFPEIQETIEGAVFNHIAIGPNEFGDGSIVRTIECSPHVDIIKGYKPKVIVANIPEPLPENLNPIAMVIWHLINEQIMKPEDLHPALFAVVNEAFSAVDMPIMKVIREGTATMNVKMHDMKSLSLSQDTAEA